MPNSESLGSATRLQRTRLALQCSAVLISASIVSKKSKRLTLDERIEIEQCLNRKMTFKAIGKLLGKDQTTISKEVKKHLEVRLGRSKSSAYRDL